MSIEKVKYFSNKTFYMINIFTGSEAMFADLCYFSIKSVQVFPLLFRAKCSSFKIFYGNLQLLICCSLPLCFLFFHAFYWDTQDKLHFLWRTQIKVSRSSFCPFQVSKTVCLICYVLLHMLKQKFSYIMKLNFVYQPLDSF